MSGDDVWNDAIGELLDFVLQRQLALLHPRQLELVAIACLAEQLDFLIEATMLGLQQGQDLARVIVIHRSILQHGGIIVTPPRHRRTASATGQTVLFASDKSIKS